MILFWDRNVGKAIPRALRIVKPRGVEDVRYYAEVFPGTDNKKEEGDDPWLSDIGRLGWVVITQDHEFHNKPSELQAIQQHSVACFYLWGQRAPRWEQFQCFARAFDEIVKVEAAVPKPFIYVINRRGSLRQLL